jgi:hypothetical protein
MPEDSKESVTTIARIVIEYDTSSGQFNLHSNIGDEVLTTGMLAVAGERLKENYQLQRIKKLTEKGEKAILTVQ